ncbi:MAG TPA: DUF1905 domain-containing protein [Asticcacaulis sp.]|nr:DUF1905 domain-containing protein [Asticcacaulis sp.]
MRYKFRAKLWRWKGDAPASWVFVTLPDEVAFAIKCQAESRAWGSVSVVARVGETGWRTSLFPDKASGGYVLPVKASVRKAENLHDGDEAEVTLDLD